MSGVLFVWNTCDISLFVIVFKLGIVKKKKKEKKRQSLICLVRASTPLLNLKISLWLKVLSPKHQFWAYSDKKIFSGKIICQTFKNSTEGRRAQLTLKGTNWNLLDSVWEIWRLQLTTLHQTRTINNPLYPFARCQLVQHYHTIITLSHCQFMARVLLVCYQVQVTSG